MVNKKAQDLGRYIKMMRNEKKVSAKVFGELIGYSQSYISALENNHNNNVPNETVLKRLAKGFSEIGYSENEVLKEMYAIVGSLNDQELYRTYEKEFFYDWKEQNGEYDNVDDIFLNKPYLNLEYLLKSDLNLKFEHTYERKVPSENGEIKTVRGNGTFTLTREQKAFLYNTIKNMIELAEVTRIVSKHIDDIEKYEKLEADIKDDMEE